MVTSTLVLSAQRYISFAKMSAEHHDDDLAPETTAGFKVGEQKSIDEYHRLGKSLLNSTPIKYLSLVLRYDDMDTFGRGILLDVSMLQLDSASATDGTLKLQWFSLIRAVDYDWRCNAPPSFA